MTDSNFRLFQPQDVSAIYRMYLQNPAEIDPTTLRQELWLAYLAKAEDPNHIAEVVCPGTIFPRGLITVWRESASVAAITLFVDASQRQRGLGTMMVQRAAVLARTLPFKPTYLHASVYRNNLPSYRLFLKLFGPPIHMKNPGGWDGHYVFSRPL